MSAIQEQSVEWIEKRGDVTTLHFERLPPGYFVGGHPAPRTERCVACGKVGVRKPTVGFVHVGEMRLTRSNEAAFEAIRSCKAPSRLSPSKVDALGGKPAEPKVLAELERAGLMRDGKRTEAGDRRYVWERNRG